MEREQLLDLIPAYALGALDPDEQMALEAALPGDPEAQALLADYQQIAEHLVAMAPLQPAPAHLQTDLRQRLAAERPQAGPAAPQRRAPQPPVAPARRTPWLGRGDKILAAVAAVTMIAVAVVLLWGALSGDDTPPSDPAGLYAFLLEQPASTRYVVAAGEVSDAVSGELVVSATGEQAVLRTQALPAIGEGETFQIWLIDHEGARTSAGLFRPDQEDSTYVQVPLEQPIAAYQAVGVSLEPAGGSPFPDQPTGPRVLAVPLT
jgi:anti-sigma-K factor RskA